MNELAKMKVISVDKSKESDTEFRVKMRHQNGNVETISVQERLCHFQVNLSSHAAKLSMPFKVDLRPSTGHEYTGESFLDRERSDRRFEITTGGKQEKKYENETDYINFENDFKKIDYDYIDFDQSDRISLDFGF